MTLDRSRSTNQLPWVGDSPHRQETHSRLRSCPKFTRHRLQVDQYKWSPKCLAWAIKGPIRCRRCHSQLFNLPPLLVRIVGPSYRCRECDAVMNGSKSYDGMLSALGIGANTLPRRHVFRDLRAYVCTFGNCQNPDKQYATQQEWFSHEMQVYRRVWFCGMHKEYCASPELLFEHTDHFHLNDVP
jgi:hypothetical protein